MTHLSRQSRLLPVQATAGLPLSMILSTWADLSSDGQDGGESSFSIHARAASDRLVALEAVAEAARRLLARAEEHHSALDQETADELEFALASLAVGTDSPAGNRSRRAA